MNQKITTQESEYQETGFAISKILAHAGFRLDLPAYRITWGQIVREAAEVLADHGFPADRLKEDCVVELVLGIQGALENEDFLYWRHAVRAFVADQLFLCGKSSVSQEVGIRSKDN